MSPLPVDPGPLRGLVQWGVIPPGRLPDRSVGALRTASSDRWGWAVVHGGLPAFVVYRTQLTAGPAGVGVS